MKVTGGYGRRCKDLGPFSLSVLSFHGNLLDSFVFPYNCRAANESSFRVFKLGSLEKSSARARFELQMLGSSSTGEVSDQLELSSANSEGVSFAMAHVA